MPGYGLGCRREDRLRQRRASRESCRQRHATDCAAPAVFGQSRAGQPAANNTLKWYHFGLPYEHRAAAERLAVHRGRQVHGIDIGRDQMMGLSVGADAKPVEPECRDHGEQFPLVGNRRGEHPVEGADPVGAHNQHRVAKLRPLESVAVADLAAVERSDAEIRFGEGEKGHTSFCRVISRSVQYRMFPAHAECSVRRPQTVRPAEVFFAGTFAVGSAGTLIEKLAGRGGRRARDPLLECAQPRRGVESGPAQSPPPRGGRRGRRTARQLVAPRCWPGRSHPR